MQEPAVLELVNHGWQVAQNPTNTRWSVYRWGDRQLLDRHGIGYASRGDAVGAILAVEAAWPAVILKGDKHESIT